MTEPQPPAISDVAELIAMAELQDVVFWEVSARRNEEEDSEAHPLQIQSLWRLMDRQLGLRFRATVSGEGGDFVADTEAIFELSAQRELDPEVIREFVQRVGIMVVFPYIRSAVAESATKLSLPRPVLKLMRAGETQFTKE